MRDRSTDPTSDQFIGYSLQSCNPEDRVVSVDYYHAWRRSESQRVQMTTALDAISRYDKGAAREIALRALGRQIWALKQTKGKK